jgi:hypothetical protein
MTTTRRNDRLLEEEIRTMQRDGARSCSRASLRKLADRIAALTPKVPQTDSTDLVREDRAR